MACVGGSSPSSDTSLSLLRTSKPCVQCSIALRFGLRHDGAIDLAVASGGNEKCAHCF